MAGTEVEIRENHELRRFEAVTEDGTLAGLVSFRVEPDGSYRLVHTEVKDRFESQGVGGRLAAAALAALREQEVKVHPDCPFIASYMVGHPETLDLLHSDVDLSTPAARGDDDD